MVQGILTYVGEEEKPTSLDMDVIKVIVGLIVVLPG